MIDASASSPRVVGVHGMGQEYAGRNQLLGLWAAAFADGLEHAGRHKALPSLDVAHYGRLFPSTGSGDGATGKGLVVEAMRENDIDEVERDALLEAARDEDGGPAKGGGFPRTPTPVQDLLRRIDRRFGSGAGALYLQAFRQVRLYLTDAAVKARIDAAVADAVGADCHILVGHSLGSVVAYEYLRQHPDGPVQAFVTMGSPLGLRMIRDRLSVGGPAIEVWHNVRDERDPVACAGPLQQYWPQVVESAVDNGSKPHAAVRYLSNPTTGEVMAKLLDGAR